MLRTKGFLFKELQTFLKISKCQERLLSSHSDVFKISDEVEEALHSGKPVVALETAIVTHGMPNPINYETAKDVGSIVRESGAVPATVGVLNGRVKIGLTDTELSDLARERQDLVKISRRDMAYVISQKLSGGTTVSATMIAAHLAGIPIFVTGGIGGVHRGAESTLDISADLVELGRTPVAVVSAGVKSILDIGKTLEYLETQGVCVASYGETRDFPSFFTPKSGHLAPHSVSNPTDAAKLILSGQELNLQSGNLIAVSIPEEFASSGEVIETAIQQAVNEAREKSIVGREVTPYILRRVHELTKGQSVTANIALIKNNALVGSQIAVELSRLKREKSVRKNHPSTAVSSGIKMDAKTNIGAEHRRHYGSYRSQVKQGQPVVVGGVVVDFVSKVESEEFKLNGATYPGSVKQSFGGVGRNIADGLARLGHDPLLISAIGDDQHGKSFFSFSKHMDTSGISVLKGERTATYCAVLKHSGQLLFGIGDMVIHSKVTPQMVNKYEKEISESPLLCLDGNLTPEVIGHTCDLCSHYHVPVWYEPTDVNKAVKPFQGRAGMTLTFTSPNLNELKVMYSYITQKEAAELNLPPPDNLRSKLHLASVLCEEITKHIPVVMVTLGKDGLFLCHRLKDGHHLPIGCTVSELCDEMTTLHYSAGSIRDEEIISVSGAGDCLAAGFISGCLHGDDLDLCVKAGLKAANASLRTYHAVPKDLLPSQIRLGNIGDDALQSTAWKH